jgi:dienelactone hydrolase
MKGNFRFVIFLTVFAFAFVLTASSAEQNELNVLSNWLRWANAPNFLLEHLNQQAFAHLEKRKTGIAQLKTADEWIQRQESVKETLQQILGPFPERTPLNAQVTGVVQKDGYRIEKIMFESMPQFFVTGCLFIPDNLQGKTPAILNPIGHTGIAFRAPLYQQLAINLVKKGFIVFSFDPLSQGERLQYFDADENKSLVGGSTAEHSHFGWQCFLNGVCSARYFVWDGMRAIDYLLTRDEVDPARIGVTGLSGGGTQTAYISAMDDRVAVAAPTCYITSFHRLLESIGPQDAEQNFYREIAAGLDHADFIEIRAPKPTLLVTTTNDFFSIQGSRETYTEAKHAFAAFDAADHLQMAEDDYEHGYTKKTREAIYAFMQKHLNLPGDPTDIEIEPLPIEELTVTETGQIATALESKRVFDYNQVDTQKNLERLQFNREKPEFRLQNTVREAVRISGYQKPTEPSDAIFVGGIPKDGYRIEKYVLKSEGSCIVPLLLFVPDTNETHPAVIVLHPKGKSAGMGENGCVEALVKKGFLVASADLSGLGEVGETVSGIKAPFAGVLIGRSLPGIHAGEIVRIARFLQARNDVDRDKLAAVAYSHLCPALIHAAAFDSSLRSIALIQPLVSYEAVTKCLLYKTPGWVHVAGALTGYDLPDLAGCIAPRPLLILSPTDPTLSLMNEEDAANGYAVTKNAFRALEKSDSLTILADIEEETEQNTKLIDWLDSN